MLPRGRQAATRAHSRRHRVPTRNRGLGYVVPLPHSRLQLYHLAIYSEPAVSVMVDGLRMLLRRIDPGLEHLKDKEIIFADETGIGHLALEIGETLGH